MNISTGGNNDQSQLNYSIYIRTLGFGGDKYAKLLQSIKMLAPQPEEVVVVLPYGYDFPNERLGYERFAFSEKGMVRQRVFAINDVKTPYVLLLDDDVEFEPDFVAKLFNTMTEAQAECCVAQVSSIAPGVSRLKKIINHMIGSVVYKNTHDQFYRKINLCGGYIVNTGYDPNKPVYSQSGHGSHCFAKTAALRKIHFEDELWLEDSVYALPDDQVMFYKLYLSECRIAVCLDTRFCHLDAAVSNDGTRHLKVAQAKAGNYLIFWYRFVYTNLSGWRKYWSIAPAMFRIAMECLLYIAKCHSLEILKSTWRGLRFGVRYIRKAPRLNLK